MNIPQPTLGLLGVFVILALHLCAVYTGLGAFSLAWLSETVGAAKKKVFLKKLSQQMSALGILFLAYTLVSAGGSFAVMQAQYPELIRPWLDNPMIAAPMAAALAWLVLFGLLYAFTWRSAKKSPGLHRSLGLLTVLGVPAVLGVSLCMKLALYSELPENVQTMELEPMLRAGLSHPMLAPLTVHSVLLALGCGAGFGLLFLLTRRNKDDFGRDYYNYAAQFTANTAILGTLGALASEAWVASQMLPSLMLETGPTLLGLLAAGGGAAALLATISWAVVARSENPLRRKPAMLLAALLLLMAVAGFSAVNASIFLPL
ncbi:hypothetical protein [Desulfovibrio ferrophilus]|uniref:Uncharacterized protein n=1 Tax=Desulfovibrio ferrophilus TaxID=241368 RepID=A0A2Z6AVE6_9BACT|nr:hypothetical protein [Desulfovibrio ferrophilus]BBD07219.1 uncharacterized protein DFE_0493 [Desulfovibrio ferrophilus]